MNCDDSDDDLDGGWIVVGLAVFIWIVVGLVAFGVI